MDYNFEIGKYDITQFDGHMSIEYKVKGFWSRNIITIYIHRGYMSNPLDYDFKLSASSGGRDKEEVESDAEAYRYFAEALVDAANLIDVIKANHIKDMEKAYQEHVRELARRREEAAAERKAKIDADTVIGKAKASLVIATLRSMAVEKQYFEQNMYIRRRGSDEVVNISATMNDRAITFRVDSRRRPVKEMLKTIADFAEVVEAK